MASTPAPPRFFTYKPGTGGSKLVLKPGQTLGYQPGKGYFAKGAGAAVPPAGGGFTGVTDVSSGGGYAPGPRTRTTPPPPGRTVPPPPVDPYAASSASAVDKRAGGIAQGDIDAQSAEVRRQQALAQQQAVADEAAITGFSKAAGELEQAMPGQINDAYHQAVSDVGALGQGISGQVGHDLAAGQAQDDAFAASQGQSGGQTTSVPDVQTTLQMLNGVIPGSELAARGAAEATWAAKQPQISLDAGRHELDMRLAKAHDDNDGYAQQLITIAATYPTLKAQALTQLNQYELDKANYRLSRSNAAADNARQDRALADNEKLSGLNAATDLAKTNAEYKYKYAALQFKNAAEAKKAAAAGKIIDVGASKLLGHVVYKDGSENASLKVAKSTGANAAQTKALQNRYKDSRSAQATAQTQAVALRGKPILAPKFDQNGNPYKGKYLADPKYIALGQGKPGSVYPDGSTKNAARARHDGAAQTWAQAHDLIWNRIGADALMARYGLKKADIDAWIRRALSAAGWSK